MDASQGHSLINQDLVPGNRYKCKVDTMIKRDHSTGAGTRPGAVPGTWSCEYRYSILNLPTYHLSIRYVAWRGETGCALVTTGILPVSE